MAIDTEQKRRAALGVQTLPVANSTVDQGDRQHVADIYSGIAAGGGGGLGIAIAAYHYNHSLRK